MVATLTHSTLTHAPATAAFGGARPASLSWFARLILGFGALPSFFAEVREEQRKAHERYPHLAEW